MTRRDDIDGLRALAVVLVLLFHAQLNDLRGGFVGVDVFFVISGYLIIPLIVTAQAEGRFDFGAFLLRRLRRLVPAMVPVLAFALVVAALLLGERRFDGFLHSLLGASLYVSNHVFFAEAGYFDTDAHQKLLLHTWSLAVEFQFYLITPLVLWLARGRRGVVTGLLVVLALASFGLAELWRGGIGQGGSGAAAFYLMAPRFWEFAVGGLVAVWVTRRDGPWSLAIAMRGAGLGLILWAALSYDAATAFPGLGALPPVLGAALVLAAPQAPRDPLRWILASRGARWLGLRSYSIYLWHWPLMVTAVLYAEWASEGMMLAMAGLSILLAAVSYPLIERPPQVAPGWRAPGRILRLSAVGPVLAALLLVLPPSWRVGLPLADYRQVRDRVDAEFAAYDLTLHTAPPGPERGRQCSLDPVLMAARPAAAAALAACLRDLAGAEVLVIGDSHGRETFHALRLAFPDREIALLHASNCAPADYAPQAGVTCFAGLDAGLRAAGLRPGGTVILSSRWPLGALDRLAETGAVLADLDQRVAVVGMGPYLRVPMPNLLRAGRAVPDDAGNLRLPLEGLRLRQDSEVTEARLAAIAATAGWHFVPKFPAFCDARGCLVEVPGQPGQLLLLDGQHLTRPGFDWFADVLGRDAGLRALLAEG